MGWEASPYRAWPDANPQLTHYVQVFAPYTQTGGERPSGVEAGGLADH
jgi:hypothetical protein